MRIISLVPSITETLFELGLGDQLIAVTRFCRLPADRVKLKPKIGGTKNPKLEQIVAMKPDIVIMDQDENRKQDAEFLREHQIQVFATFPRSVEGAIDVIRELGMTFGVQREADRIIGEIKERMAVYKKPQPKRTLILIWRKPYMSINCDTYAHDICAFFGFDNIFAHNPERFPKLTDEEIESANPEVVVMPDEPYPFREKNVQEFKQAFPYVDAAWANQFLLCDGTYVTWPGYGTLRALREFPALICRLEQ